MRKAEVWDEGEDGGLKWFHVTFTFYKDRAAVTKTFLKQNEQKYYDKSVTIRSVVEEWDERHTGKTWANPSKTK